MRRERRLLRAGPLSCICEDGILRSVRCGDVELVRRVYMALRDRYWNTIPFTIDTLSLESDADSFDLVFKAAHRADDIGFTWQCSIKGRAEGIIELSMHGSATTSFFRNRIGWCVLHPLAGCKGVPCTIEHTDGSNEVSHFPGADIVPTQPFVDIRTMRYEVAPGMHCSVEFAGDIFETEDQRNWTDATFKTYSTPQSLPVPVEVPQGTVIEQRVRIGILGAPVSPTATRRTPEVAIGKLFASAGPAPAIGVRHMYGGPPMEPTVERIGISGPAHLRADIVPSDTGAREQLHEVCKLAAAVGAGVELGIHCSELFDEELQWLAAVLQQADQVPVRFLIYDTRSVVTLPETVAAALCHLGNLKMRRELFAGTDRYFVEINRSPVLVEAVEGVTFSANPQVHTFDNRAVMENTEGLAECIRAARCRYDKKKLALSPLTMRPRKDLKRPWKDGGADPRQQELFGASWLTASIASCIDAGVDVLTACADTGPEGIMTQDGSRLFPLYHIFASGICRAERSSSVRITDDEHLLVAVAFTHANRNTLLIANGTDGNVDLHLTGVPAGTARAVLDATTVDRAATDPQFWEHEQQPEHGVVSTLHLDAYAVVRLVLP